jgi:AcrR family transcriptional regulator
LNSKEKILVKAKTLFAEKGFANVSMRNLAKAVNLSVAAIYHHFPDKNTLYLETVQFAFRDKALIFSEIFQQHDSAETKLRKFVSSLIHELSIDREFHQLIQRELVDANPKRVKLLAEDVFNEQFCLLLTLIKQIIPEKDAYLSAISVLSLCKHHLEMQPICRFLPEWKPQHDEQEVIARHITEILLKGLV